MFDKNPNDPDDEHEHLKQPHITIEGLKPKSFH